jgi:hypothetical protein
MVIDPRSRGEERILPRSGGDAARRVNATLLT